MLPATITEGATARPTCTTDRHTASNYSKRRCRCPVGQEAWRLYRKRWKTGRTPVYSISAVGSRRRVQGLMMLGWSREQIARTGGLTGRYAYDLVGRIAAGQRTYVTLPTATAVQRAEDLLSTEEGPSQRVRTLARRLGYLPFEAWSLQTIDNPAAQPYDWLTAESQVDEVAIERVVRAGRYSLPEGPELAKSLTKPELRAALVRLSSLRITDKRVAANLGVCPRTVGTYRAAAGIPRVTWDEQRAAA